MVRMATASSYSTQPREQLSTELRRESGAETVTTDKTTQPVTRTVASSLEQIPSLLVPRLRIYAALLHSNFSQSLPTLSQCGSMRRDLGKMISGEKRPRSAGPMLASASRAARLTRIRMYQKDNK